MYIYSHVVFYAIGIKFAISFYPVLFPVCAVLPTHSRPQLSQDSRSVSAARLLLFPRSSRLCPRLLGRDLFPALPAAPGRAPPLFQIVSPAPPVPDRTLTPVFEAAVSPGLSGRAAFPGPCSLPGRRFPGPCLCLWFPVRSRSAPAPPADSVSLCLRGCCSRNLSLLCVFSA